MQIVNSLDIPQMYLILRVIPEIETIATLNCLSAAIQFVVIRPSDPPSKFAAAAASRRPSRAALRRPMAPGVPASRSHRTQF